MNNDIEWEQDMSSVTVRVPVKRSAAEKISLTVYSCFIKISTVDNSVSRTVDLSEPVRMDGYTWSYSNGEVVAKLLKTKVGIWGSLMPRDVTKGRLRELREQSIKELEAFNEQVAREKAQRQDSMVKQSSEIRWQLEKEQREGLVQMKQKEKSDAIECILGPDTTDLVTPELGLETNAAKSISCPVNNVQKEESGHLDQLNGYHDGGDKAPEKLGICNSSNVDDIEVDHTESLNQIVSVNELGRIAKLSSNPARTDSIRSFDAPVELKFTERVFPGVAMREQHLLQAPNPQSSKNPPKREGMTFEELLEKIRFFIREGDLGSASSAITEARKLQENDPLCTLNMITVHLRRADLSLAESEIKRAEAQIRDHPQKTLYLAFLKIRQIAFLALSNELPRAKELYLEALAADDRLEKVGRADIDLLDKRILSNEFLEGSSLTPGDNVTTGKPRRVDRNNNECVNRKLSPETNMSRREVKEAITDLPGDHSNGDKETAFEVNCQTEEPSSYQSPTKAAQEGNQPNVEIAKEQVSLKEFGVEESERFNQELSPVIRTLEIDPSNERAWNRLGVYHQSQTNHAMASKCVRKALSTTECLVQRKGLDVESLAFKSSLMAEEIVRLRDLDVEVLEQRGDLQEVIERIKETKRMYGTLGRSSETERRVRRKLRLEEYNRSLARLRVLASDGRIEEALEEAQRAERVIRNTGEPVEYIRLVTNKTSLLTHLGRFSEVVAETGNGLRAMDNLEGNVIDEGMRRQFLDSKDLLKELKVRLLIRRANALVNQEQWISARKDLEAAQTTAPENQEITDLLEDLKSQMCQ